VQANLQKRTIRCRGCEYKHLLPTLRKPRRQAIH